MVIEKASAPAPNIGLQTIRAIISLFGLVIFVIFGAAAIFSVVCKAGMTCPAPLSQITMSDLAIGVLNVIAGAITTVIVSFAAIADPKTGVASASAPAFGKSKLGTIVTWAFVICWAVFGVAALVIGTLLYPNVLPALDNLGQAFFGVLVPTLLAYFGLKR